MSTPSSPKIAVIGSGPAGCYLTQSLLRTLPDCEVAVFDRLASPFGLIRYGVAADHQHTKAITRQFDRLFQAGAARFAGDIEIGRDLSIDQLHDDFDAIVLATGLSADRALEIPGADLPGVIGAGVITRVLNAHPHETERLPELGSDVVIIGGGNVAIDVLRFLVKDYDGFDASDVSDAALEAYLSSPAGCITLVSRSPAPDSKGDPQMLKELASLPRANYSSPDRLAPEPGTELDRSASNRVAAISEMVSPDRPHYPGPEVILRFGLTPLRMVGAERVEGVEFAVGHRTEFVPARSVITAIGFSPEPEGSVSEMTAESAVTGRIEPGLYRTGWAKRGPRGAIPENRACAKAVADEIVTDLAEGSLTVSPHKRGFEGLPTAVRERAISYEQWLTLEAHERELAARGRIRRKLPNHDQMVAIARRAIATTDER